MFGRIAFLLSALTATALLSCQSEPPDPVFIGGEEADGDADGDADADDEGVLCDAEKYPCGPYGHTACDVVADLRFIPANEYATDIAGDDGIFSLSDIYADESVLGVLLFGTAGW